MEGGEEKLFTYVFEKGAQGKPTFAVTGGYGGPDMYNRSVVAHLFVEYPSVPSLTTAPVGEQGQILPNTESPVKRGDATREMQASLVMSPETAIALGRFLLQAGKTAVEKRIPEPPQQ